MPLTATHKLLKFQSWDDGFWVTGIAGGRVPRARAVTGVTSGATAMVVGISVGGPDKILKIIVTSGTFQNGETVKLTGEPTFPPNYQNPPGAISPGSGVLLAVGAVVDALNPPLTGPAP